MVTWVLVAVLVLVLGGVAAVAAGRTGTWEEPERDRVAPRLQGRHVHHVNEDGAALDVAQEVKPQALALGGAGDEARHVGDGERVTADIDDTEVRLQRCEWVVRDLRFRSRQG